MSNNDKIHKYYVVNKIDGKDVRSDEQIELPIPNILDSCDQRIIFIVTKVNLECLILHPVSVPFSLDILNIKCILIIVLKCRF